MDAQTTFPWQSKTRKDCAFWATNICQVVAEYRSSTVHTCTDFDPSNHEQARTIIRERQSHGVRHWWEWFNGRGVTR